MKTNRLIVLIIAAVAFVIGMSLFGRPAGETASASFDGMVSFLLQDWLAPAVAIGMLILAALTAAFYIGMHWIPTAQSLASFQRIFYEQTATAFAQDHEQIRARASRDPLIGHEFKEFSETLLPGKLRGGRIASTMRPNVFINYAALRNSSPSLRIAPSLPGYFVGFGLLFTFIGLLAALYQASDAVGSPQVSTAQFGLQGLLAAAAFKFWTSIAGLFAALILSFTFRWMTASLESRTLDVCRAIESVTTFAPAQRLQGEANMLLEEQLYETRKFNAETATAIAHAIGAQLERNFASVMNPIVQSAQDAAKAIRASNGDNAQMVEEIVRVIRTEVSALRRSVENFETGLESLNRAVTHQSAALERAVAGMEMGPSRGYSEESAISIARAINGQLERDLAQALRVGLAPVADSLREGASELRATHEETRRLSEQIGSNLRSLELAWASYRERFEHVDQDLEKTFERLVSQVWSNQQQAVDFLSKMNVGFDHALDRLGTAVSDIGRRTEELSDSVAVFVNRLPQAAE